VATRLLDEFSPIAKSTINIPAGVLVDFIFGFGISAIFLLIRDSVPGKSRIMKGINFGLGLWFLRVLMGVATYCVMFDISLPTLGYIGLTGLAEMVMLGIINALIIYPKLKG
jgi:hypothetical protein